MSTAKVRQACESVVTINVTPFNADGGVDLDAYAVLVDRCVSAGIDVVTANGNTGEFYSLDRAEQAVAVRTTVSAAAGRAVVLAGVGHAAAEAAAEAVDATGAGAHGVMVHQPVHPYQSTEGWVAYHREVADAIPDHGVVCYVRNPAIRAEAFVRLADACPNVVGVKYAVPDPIALADIVAAVGPVGLVLRAGGELGAVLLALRCPWLHLGPGDGGTGALAGPARHAAQGRYRGRDGGVATVAALRGPAGPVPQRVERVGGQGGAGAARPVPAGCPPADQPAQRCRAGRGGGDTQGAVSQAALRRKVLRGRPAAGAPSTRPMGWCGATARS